MTDVKTPRLKRISPKQAYSFSRLVQKRALEDPETPQFTSTLRGTGLKLLADEIIDFRDGGDLSKASRGARAIVRELRAATVGSGED